MYARYFEEFMAWFICKNEGIVCHRIYGPFDEDELEIAKNLHGI